MQKLRRELKACHEDLSTKILRGVPDYAAYREALGELRGLGRAIELIESRKGSEEEDEK